MFAYQYLLSPKGKSESAPDVGPIQFLMVYWHSSLVTGEIRQNISEKSFILRIGRIEGASKVSFDFPQIQVY